MTLVGINFNPKKRDIDIPVVEPTQRIEIAIGGIRPICPIGSWLRRMRCF